MEPVPAIVESQHPTRGVAAFKTNESVKYHLRVCTNISCMLRGGDDLFETICKHYGVSNKQKSADGLVFVEEFSCLGSCESAPVIAVNDEFYEFVDQDDLPILFSELT